MLKVKITKLKYNEINIPPLMVVFECDLWEDEHKNLFPPEALIDRMEVNDLEHEKAALEFIIQETIQRKFPDEKEFSFEWATTIDTSLLTKYLPEVIEPPQDYSYLYSG